MDDIFFCQKIHFFVKKLISFTKKYFFLQKKKNPSPGQKSASKRPERLKTQPLPTRPKQSKNK